MKLFPLLFLVSLCSADRIQKRASVADKATLGYATLNGGTSGGGTATPVTVSTLPGLKVAVQGNTPKVVLLDGMIGGSEIVDVGGNTTLIGKLGAGLEGVGIRVNATENVIIRNIKISKVLSSTGDAIRTISSSRIWIDHMDLSADRDNDKNYYGGLIYIANGTAGISVTNCYLHDHWRAVLGGLSDAVTNEAKVTWAYNKWRSLTSGLPTVRWGMYHVLRNYYVDNTGSITASVGSDISIEANVFESMNKPVVNSGGTVRAQGNIGYTPSPGTYVPAEYPYVYIPGGAEGVKAMVNSGAGAILEF